MLLGSHGRVFEQDNDENFDINLQSVKFKFVYILTF